MADINCIVCGEPWDGYGARHGDMAPWEYTLFRTGAGCPCCEGETPDDADPEEIAYDVAKRQVFSPGTDDDALVDNFVCIADGTTSKRPKWERPDDPTLWTCHACPAHVVRDLDTGDLDWRKLGQGLYNLPHRADIDPPETAPYIVDGNGYCPVCAQNCDECDTPMTSEESYAHPLDMRSALCEECICKIPSCSECGAHWHDDDDAASCCSEDDK